MSEQFQRLMADHGIVCSMSRASNVWDNAAMESFFSSLKTERTARKSYRTRPRQGRRVRLHRAFLQSAAAFDDRLSQPDGARKPGAVSLGWYPPNRQRFISNSCNRACLAFRCKFVPKRLLLRYLCTIPPIRSVRPSHRLSTSLSERWAEEHGGTNYNSCGRLECRSAAIAPDPGCTWSAGRRG